MLIRLSTWSCLDIRMQYEVTGDNCFFEGLEEFRYLGTNITNENYNQE